MKSDEALRCGIVMKVIRLPQRLQLQVVGGYRIRDHESAGQPMKRWNVFICHSVCSVYSNYITIVRLRQ